MKNADVSILQTLQILFKKPYQQCFYPWLLFRITLGIWWGLGGGEFYSSAQSRTFKVETLEVGSRYWYILKEPQGVYSQDWTAGLE